ncbi:unnamed protein product [Paramecium primaurelia]|uniref:Uncharacterized protein n=1 Tax=Paramecium primaurelia TaxID=5886 RepID=A0A8S1MFE9_PARPR|nr:unnamed protein product [Paramecium primaurelia]
MYKYKDQFDMLIKFIQVIKLIHRQSQNQCDIIQQCKFTLQSGTQNQIQMNIQIFNPEVDKNYSIKIVKRADGPAKFDCISCSIKSQRIYLALVKVCICPYNIDEKICKTCQKNTQIQLIIKNDIKNYCQN